MCGIVGVAFKQIDRQLFEKMTDQMELRGPDGQGTWFSERGDVALGHRRLSIIDLSETGRQPMQDESGRWVVTFNGEIYNFHELKMQLVERGVSFRGHSDTEVLVNALVVWGVEETLVKLNGMFAFSAWDNKLKKLVLARDRFGEKPLHYSSLQGAFIFASELKPLFLYPGFEKKICYSALDMFFKLSYVPAPNSIFESVKKLLPGHYLEVSSPDDILEKRYWSPEEEAKNGLLNPFSGNQEEAIDEVERLLEQSVRLRSISDVPLGCFLSGGIDSSLITAMMTKVSHGDVSTFSIGFDRGGFDESVFAKKVASHLGTKHTELYLSDQDARDVIPQLPRMYDEPFADSSQIPTFLVSKMARDKVTVCLSGDAGDELFGGYTRYLQGPQQFERFSRVPGILRKVGSHSMQALGPKTWDALYGVAKYLLPKKYQVLHFGEKLQKLAGAVDQAHSPQLFYQNLIMQTPSLQSSLVLGMDQDLPEMAWREDWSFVQNMMMQDVIGYLAGDILTKVDRASMGVSLESRVPFLDPDLFRFAWSLPHDFKMRNGQGKWILRQLLARHVPKSLFERPKSGFAIPIATWLRGPLRDWAESLLPRSGDHPHLDTELIQHLWEEHLKGRRDHNAILWNILMFSAWEEKWMR